MYLSQSEDAHQEENWNHWEVPGPPAACTATHVLVSSSGQKSLYTYTAFHTHLHERAKVPRLLDRTGQPILVLVSLLPTFINNTWHNNQWSCLILNSNHVTFLLEILELFPKSLSTKAQVPSVAYKALSFPTILSLIISTLTFVHSAPDPQAPLLFFQHLKDAATPVSLHVLALCLEKLFF